MTELFDEGVAVDEVEIPSTLPVLPLKDTVVFPDSMLPLAIGQERSIALIDDVIAGDRLVALVAARSREIEVPDWDDLFEVGTAAGGLSFGLVAELSNKRGGFLAGAISALVGLWFLRSVLLPHTRRRPNSAGDTGVAPAH